MMYRLLSLVLLIPFGLSVQAQETSVSNGQVFGAWAVNCSAVGVGETACVLNQVIQRDTDNAFITQMMAFQNADASKTYLAARVPIGVYLPTRFAIRAEEGDEVLSFVWQACRPDLCEAIVEVEPDFLADLASDGRTVLGAFRPSPKGETFVFRFAMTGAMEGLAALQAAKSK